MISITNHEGVNDCEFPIDLKYSDYITIHMYLISHGWHFKDELIDVDSSHYRTYQGNGVEIIISFDFLYGIKLSPANKHILQLSNVLIEGICNDLERVLYSQ